MPPNTKQEEEMRRREALQNSYRGQWMRPEQEAEPGLAGEVYHSLPQPVRSGIGWVAEQARRAREALTTPPAHPGTTASPEFRGAPSRTAVGLVADPKTAERAAIQATARQALEPRDPRGQGQAQAPAAPPAPPPGTPQSAPQTQPATDTSAPAVKDREADYYAGIKFVKTPEGRVIATDPQTAAQHVARGARWMTYEDAMRERGQGKSEASSGADVVYGSAGSAFVRPGQRAGGFTVPDSRPYSEKLKTLEAELPEIDPSKRGGWTFSGGIGTGKPREGHGTLSGLEQAMARRDWLEGRRRFEQASEVADAELETQKAKLGYERKVAEQDPLAVAQIAAQGRYGGEYIKASQEADAQRRAAAVYDAYTQQIDRVREALASLPAGDPRVPSLREHLTALERERLERTNIALGAWIRPERQDFLSSLVGALGTAPTAPARPEPGT